MFIQHIWRYPVKTMGGEEVQCIRLGPKGMEGDRVVHVSDAGGNVLTSRSHPRFLGHRAVLGADGEPLVDGQPWSHPDVAAKVQAIGGTGARLRRYDGVERFDVLPLLVGTDGAIAEFGHDYRRLRPNIVVGGVPGMGEVNWPGKRLHIGEVVIGMQDLRGRCIMTSFDPDTQAQDKRITRGIYDRFNGVLALNCWVIQGGEIRVGDAVEVVSG